VNVYTQLHLYSSPFTLAVSDNITSCWFAISELDLLNYSLCDLPQSFKRVRVFFSTFSSISTLIYHIPISIKRWFYIVHLFLHQRLVTTKLTECCLILVWIFSALINIDLPFLIWDSMYLVTTINFRVIRPVINFFSLLFNDINIFQYLLHSPSSLRDINKLRPTGDSGYNHQTNQPMKSLKSTWKNIRMLVTVFGVHFIFLIPQMCIDMYVCTSDETFYRTAGGKIMDMIMCML
jgi:hypothetical protein